MQLRYGFRVYPDADQRTALAKAFGSARVVYNDALRVRETAREAGEAYPKTGAVVQAADHRSEENRATDRLSESSRSDPPRPRPRRGWSGPRSDGGATMGVKRDLSGLKQVLVDVAFPAVRDRIVARALESGGDEEMVSALRSIPSADYHEPNEVLRAVPLPEHEPGSHTPSAQASERGRGPAL